MRRPRRVEDEPRQQPCHTRRQCRGRLGARSRYRCSVSYWAATEADWACWLCAVTIIGSAARVSTSPSSPNRPRRRVLRNETVHIAQSLLGSGPCNRFPDPRFRVAKQCCAGGFARGERRSLFGGLRCCCFAGNPGHNELGQLLFPSAERESDCYPSSFNVLGSSPADCAPCIRPASAAELPSGERFGWHALRRKFASELKHIPLKDLCELGGWRSAQTILTCYQQGTSVWPGVAVNPCS